MKFFKKLNACVLMIAILAGMLGVTASALDEDAMGDICFTIDVWENVQPYAEDEKGGQWTASVTAYTDATKSTAFVSFDVTVKYTYSPQLGYSQIYDTQISNVKSQNGYQSIATKNGTLQNTENKVWVYAGYRESGGTMKMANMSISVNSSGAVSVGGSIIQ